MKNIKKFLFVLLLCMPLVFVNAKEEELNTLPEEIPVIEDADYKAGDTVTTEGKFFGSAFYAGNNITSNSIIDGIGFLAGNNVTIEGEQDYLITAGNNITVNGEIKRDAIIAGNTINITGNIKRDTIIAGASVTISGNVDRNVKIYASEITIKGSIKGNVEVNAGIINIEETAVIEGYLKHNDNATINKKEGSTVGEIKLYTVRKNQEFKVVLKNTIYNFLTSYANLLIVALVLTYLLPRTFTMLKTEYTKIKADDYLKLFAKGMLFLVMLPFLSMILLLSSVGFALGLIVLALYFILAYISIIFTGYLVGEVIGNKIFKKDNNKYLNLLVGIFVIKLLELIPIIGSVISILSLFVGLGIIVEKLIIKKK